MREPNYKGGQRNCFWGLYLACSPMFDIPDLSLEQGLHLVFCQEQAKVLHSMQIMWICL